MAADCYTERTFSLCTEEYSRMMKIVLSRVRAADGSLGTAAPYRVCFRPGMVNDDVSILFDSGEEIDITHLEHG